MNPLIKSLVALLLCSWVGNTFAQDSSLMLVNAPAANSMAPSLENSSFIYNPLPPEAQIRSLALHDVITVLVDYRSVALSEGSGEIRKTGSYNSVLSDWIQFDGKSIFPDPLTRGDPTVAGQVNSQLRAESDVESRESLTFPIAAQVVDIRPNGNLVIEGRRRIRINEEVWMTYLRGSVPRQSIGPDRTVRDTSIAGLEIAKYEEGAVRDGYSRGWLSRFYGKYKPF